MKNLALILLTTLISIGTTAQNRIVLLEQFSNSGCPPCASATPPVLSFVKNNPTKVTAITYHTAYPYLDSMYYENPVESDARVDFYGSFGVPYSILDGNYYRNNSSSLLSNIQSTIDSRLNSIAKFNIKANEISINENNLHVELEFKSLDNSIASEDLRAQIVVIEKHVEKSSYAASPGKNSETYYSNVMRKFLTDVNGYSIINKNINDTTLLEKNWIIKNFKDVSELRIIAFVQNASTKEIYQSMLFNPFIINGINEETDKKDYTIYPNPTSMHLNIRFQELGEREIKLYNSLGQLLQSEKTTETNYQIEKQSAGFYFIEIKSGSIITRTKVIFEN